MLNLKKTLFIILALGISLYSSYYLAYWSAEKFFYDKFFYKKSEVYGYTKNNSNRLGSLGLLAKNDPIKRRIGDLISLVDTNDQKDVNRQVLGAKADNVFKIAVIGDSFVYGLGVKTSERFTDLLEKKLNKIRPVKIYNLALPGDDILDDYAKYLLAEQRFRPDLYIFGILTNDLLFQDVDQYPGKEEIYKDIRRICPGEEFSLSNESLDREEYIIRAIYPSFLDKYANICYLKEIASRIDRKKVIFFNLDSMEKGDSLTESGEKQNYAINKYDEVIRSSEGKLISYDGPYETVSKKEGHPSGSTHEQYADFLYNYIINDPIWRNK